MRIVVGVIVLLLAHHATAEAKCKRGGKVLFRATTGHLPDVGDQLGSPTKLTVFATGAWDQVVGDGTRSGCLSKPHLKELKRSLGKAKFQIVTGESHCRARTTMEVTYASPKRKKSITFAAPCSDEPDDWTRNLAACAELATTDAKPAKATIHAVCRGLELPE
jgi:hypothetical protein